jgi:rhamnosyltransferase
MMPSVSIVIPTYNAEAWLRESLPHFLRQSYAGDWDILAIDSGSTDGTLTLLEPHERIRVHSIPNSEFGHGKTRNLATSLSKNELLLFTVQDACPRNPHWLSGMVNDLLAYNLDAVCGGQAVPHDADKNPVQWYRPVNETNEVEAITGNEFMQWSPEQQMRACGWDNVNALYKRETLLKTPFEDVRFGEDMAWAKAHLGSGGVIGYAKAHKVWHYHHQHPGFTRKRVLNQLYWRHKTIGAKPPLTGPPTFLQSLKTLKAITVHAGIWNPLEVIRWLTYNRRLQKESYEAGQEFLQAALKGSEELDNLYESLGTTSPMATKQKNP